MLCINYSGIEIDKTFYKNLSAQINSWKFNSIPIALEVEKTNKEDQYSFIQHKDIREILDKGIEFNLLKAKIDIFFKDNKLYNGILFFKFYIGFSDEEFQSIARQEKFDVEKKRKLDIFPVEPKFSFEQLVLPVETKYEIESVISLIENMNKIYYDWGFSEIDPVPRSIVNFWGPPGTGKTMAVHAISKELNKKVLILNYADIESKYVGEAPKNLMSAFDIAQKEGSVIFFDEADSFLGKRITNVDSGSEQAINSLRSQLLMKLEEYNGVVFFATNLHENYDRAFESRILKHIEFKLPDEKGRKELIRKKLPVKAPYAVSVRNESSEFDDELLTKLSKLVKGFSGREIKNCILEVLVQAAVSEQKIVTREILLSVFKKKKSERDALTKKEADKKEKIRKQIKKNLDGNNYNIRKENADGSVKIIRKKRKTSKTKN